MERSAPASRMDRAVARDCGEVESEGIKALDCRRASFALESCELADEVSPLRNECWSEERTLSSEFDWDLAEGMANGEAVASVWVSGVLSQIICLIVTYL